MRGKGRVLVQKLKSLCFPEKLKFFLKGVFRRIGEKKMILCVKSKKENEKENEKNWSFCVPSSIFYPQFIRSFRGGGGGG